MNDSVPEMDFVFNAVPGFGGSGGTNSSIARVGLVPPTERKRSQQKIAKDLNEKLSQFNNARIFAVQEQTISVGSGSRSSLPVQFVIQNVDLNKIKTVLPKFLEEARNEKTFQNVDVNLKFNKPELLMTFDRIKINVNSGLLNIGGELRVYYGYQYKDPFINFMAHSQNGLFTLDKNVSAEGSEVSLTNTSGKEVFRSKLTSNTFETKQPQGVYIMNITTKEGRSYSKKVIIK